jgi:Uma2 family endonuclease
MHNPGARRTRISATLHPRYNDAMNILTKPRLTVDEFLAWAVDHPGRYELFRGEIYPMSPETVGHVEVKGFIYVALAAAIRQRRLACHVLTDGTTVRVDPTTAYEPDALVYCGDKLDPNSLEVPNPVVIVEVLSPSSCRVDVSLKLAGYFRLPSVAHYLIVDPTQPSIIHHSRSTGETIMTRIVTDGSITLDPPGLELAVHDIYGPGQA